MQQPALALMALTACVALHASEAILPIVSNCCTEVSHHISKRLLQRVTTCRIQKVDGDCDLAAVILHVKSRRFCVSPHNHILKQWLKKRGTKKNVNGNICPKKKLYRKRKRNNSKAAQQGRQSTQP